MRLFFVCAVVACASVAWPMPSVHAHARLKESSPAVGAVLDAAPTEVSITFSNDIQRITGTYGIDVTDEAGADVTAGPPVLADDDRSLLSVPLRPSLPAGRYIVTYRNVSDVDGDPFEGSYAFYVGVEPTAEQLAADRELLPDEEATPQPTDRPSTPATGETPAASATAAAPSDGGDGGGNAGVIIIVVIAVVGVIAGFFGYRFLLQRRT